MSSKALRVLVLEDRPEDVELILRALRRDGYTVDVKVVDTEADYRAALREDFDVVLSDYSLPQFNAPRALEILQEQQRDTPFLVITGSISEEVAVECMKRGAADYLLKDRLVRLGSAIEQALEIRNARRQHQEAEERLRITQHAVDHSPLAVLRSNLRGDITYANEAACRFTGFTIEELTSKHISDLDASRPADSWQQQLSEIRARGAMTYESTCRRKDGSTFPAEITVSYIEFAGQGRILYFISDITDRKKTIAVLVESEKMRTVAGLAAGMAHEINNPLAGVMQNAEVVLSRVSPEVPANRAAAEGAGTTMDTVYEYMKRRGIPEMLQSVRESGRRAADIVANMLQFSQARSGRHAPNRLDVLLERSLELARFEMSRIAAGQSASIKIIRDYDPELGPVSCNEAEMQQVFLNILKNATQALASMPNTVREPQLVLRTRASGRDAVIEIEDNGPGMPQEVIQRAFEPFFTTKPTGEGTGLGLFVCYFIVTENHHGSIRIRSEGQGTSVVMTLPRAS